MADSPADNSPNLSVDPTSLSIKYISRLLSAAGGKKITPDQIETDLAAGAPIDREGRINLVHYTAWLLKEVQTR